jgi:hypothetical protein
MGDLLINREAQPCILIVDFAAAEGLGKSALHVRGNAEAIALHADLQDASANSCCPS